MRRRVGHQNLILAHVSQNWQSRFYRIGQKTLSLGLRDNLGHQVVAGAAIGLDLDPRVLGLESFRELFVRTARERRIPNDFTFSLGTGKQALFAVGSGVSR